MHKLGKRQLMIELQTPLERVRALLAEFSLELSADNTTLTYTYDPHKTHTGIDTLLKAIAAVGLKIKDVHSVKTSLEEIFVNLVKGNGSNAV